ncbi:uncharacterized protein LOC115875348 [Sitophilus oryzae]|uniref:Uncharacterized protein LOC115875348 n=1 Tax=Sitophilus oryzae TaxID=7048 RepID=A0A6J2X6J1_SITOR|nr:uncharacterized protein LOC115875348 [Sitophilus oryzae]
MADAPIPIHNWGKSPSPSCECGKNQTIKHIVEECSETTYNGRREDFLLARKLKGAKDPPRVLKPEDLNPQANRDWRSQIGMAPATQSAYLNPVGHRMLSHYAPSENKEQYANKPSNLDNRNRNYRGDLEVWISQCNGDVDYYVTQALSGHGCFNKYLHKYPRSETAVCLYCSEEDDAKHTLLHFLSVADGKSKGGYFSGKVEKILMLRI